MMHESMRTLVMWLQAHAPDDWHQVAIDWNWDAGTEVLAWIAAQPTCDRATAQYLIVNGAPDYYVAYRDRDALMADAPYNVEVFDLLLPVIQRWNAGFYTRSAIQSYEPRECAAMQRRYRAAEAARNGHPLPWQLDDAVFQPLDGRAFEYRYTEGWPPEVEADLKARGIRY